MDETRFFIGQIIEHKLFAYKGIIFDVDFQYSETTEWYENVAHSRPSKDQPWYRVIVDNASHQTYVAEQNLSISTAGRGIKNPLVDHYFTKTDANVYVPKIITN